MITFDTPYNGVIKQSITNSKITIKLQDASIESSKSKRVSSRYLHSLTITPMAGYTQIVASLPSSVKLKASKTSDAYGLRLRFSNKSSLKRRDKALATSNSLSALPTKKDGSGMRNNYIIVSIILIIGILILLYIKKKATNVTKQNSWLFEQNNTPQEEKNTKQNLTKSDLNNSSDVSIRFQKNINNENSVVMLDFMDQNYLVLMGKNNILLDKFVENKPSSQEDFETILQERHDELDEFMQIQNEQQKEALQAYKERAATIAYDDN
jgi:arsenate reductase-like glutaredoxin family protein